MNFDHDALFAKEILNRIGHSAGHVVVAIFSSRQNDPRIIWADEYTTAEKWEARGEELGLNRPMIAQYVDWIADSMRFDFGVSLVRRTSARSIALEHATETLRLLAGGLAFAVILSAAAILAMIYIGERTPEFEHAGPWARVIVPAIPPFIPGILLAHIIFPNSLLFPVTGNGSWSYLLPSAALGMIMAYVVVRLFDAVRTDAAKPDHTPENLTTGTSRGANCSRNVVWHMLLNLLRSSRFYLPVLLAAVIFTELIFDMRGLSNFIFGFTLLDDLPLAASAFMILTMAYVVAMLLMDVARAFVDPQVRRGA